MSKGGSSSSSSSGGSPAPAVEEEELKPYANLPQALNFEPFMPGQQEALVNQLMAGFGSQMDPEMNNRFDGMTAPMSVPMFREPLTETKAALKANNKYKNVSTGFLALDRVLGIDLSDSSIGGLGGSDPIPYTGTGSSYDESGGK